MSESVTIIENTGFVDHNKINTLLQLIKDDRHFKGLHRTTGKRLYAIIVECLENIERYSARAKSGVIIPEPYISVVMEDDKITISSGNPVDRGKTCMLTMILNRVNTMTDNDLVALYEKNINRESLPEENGAGLGFIIMKLKSGSRIVFSFTDIKEGLSYFKMQISLNKYIMRKLVIEKTSFSPEVKLDPEKDLFVISGESRPPDVANFYGEILKWFDDFRHSPYSMKEADKSIAINFDFEYFNSTSAKYLLDLCKQIAAARSGGMNIAVNWHYEENDLDMLEAGREMSRIARLPFEFILRANEPEI
ncbi:MAG: DUF1987 domain-containing protein [Bacteroidales bacterium]|nr:DUF1987 domain-containing protein [Bacteroidales bacterium]